MVFRRSSLRIFRSNSRIKSPAYNRRKTLGNDSTWSHSSSIMSVFSFGILSFNSVLLKIWKILFLLFLSSKYLLILLLYFFLTSSNSFKPLDEKSWAKRILYFLQITGVTISGINFGWVAALSNRSRFVFGRNIKFFSSRKSSNLFLINLIEDFVGITIQSKG